MAVKFSPIFVWWLVWRNWIFRVHLAVWNSKMIPSAGSFRFWQVKSHRGDFVLKIIESSNNLIQVLPVGPVMPITGKRQCQKPVQDDGHVVSGWTNDVFSFHFCPFSGCRLQEDEEIVGKRKQLRNWVIKTQSWGGRRRTRWISLTKKAIYLEVKI